MVDVATRDRGRLRVGMDDNRRANGTRPPPACRSDCLAALDDAPAVVARALDPVDRLPEFPADIPRPKLARHAVEAHPPRVAEPKRPDLRPSPRNSHERIIARDSISQT